MADDGPGTPGNTKPPLREPEAMNRGRLVRDAIPGYRGYISGVKSETLLGECFAHTNISASSIRPHLRPEFQHRDDKRFYRWTNPPDPPQGLRPSGATMEWTRRMHYPEVWPAQPRDHGAALPGYGGHESLRAKRGHSVPVTLPAGTRHSLPTLMHKDRDYQPWDEHRVAIPGYSGHVRHRHL
mmetsp:Transcript_73811/g.175711  ORF Transcript_73811/g.175711 Transcript_73811/m.175711 type:complete len:183 (+) Transcript_73811:62-610(+)